MPAESGDKSNEQLPSSSSNDTEMSDSDKNRTEKAGRKRSRSRSVDSTKSSRNSSRDTANSSTDGKADKEDKNQHKDIIDEDHEDYEQNQRNGLRGNKHTTSTKEGAPRQPRQRRLSISSVTSSKKSSSDQRITSFHHSHDSKDAEDPVVFQIGRRLVKKSQINSRDRAGRSVLFKIAKDGQVDLCEQLLHLGADFTIQDYAGYTALHEAALNGQYDLAKLLLEVGVDVNAAAINGDTALHDAVENSHLDVVELLLQFGADMYLANDRDITPLDAAEDDDEVLDLLKKWEDGIRTVVQRDKTGQTPLHKAAHDGDVAKVKEFIKYGADVNELDNAGWTPLHEAVLNGHMNVVQVLLDYGADVNARSHINGETPLIDAASNNHVAITKLLLQYGADPLLANKAGQHAVDVSQKDSECHALLTRPIEDWLPHRRPLYRQRVLAKTSNCHDRSSSSSDQRSRRGSSADIGDDKSFDSRHEEADGEDAHDSGHRRKSFQKKSEPKYSDWWGGIETYGDRLSSREQRKLEALMKQWADDDPKGKQDGVSSEKNSKDQSRRPSAHDVPNPKPRGRPRKRREDTREESESNKDEKSDGEERRPVKQKEKGNDTSESDGEARQHRGKAQKQPRARGQNESDEEVVDDMEDKKNRGMGKKSQSKDESRVDEEHNDDHRARESAQGKDKTKPSHHKRLREEENDHDRNQGSTQNDNASKKRRTIPSKQEPISVSTSSLPPVSASLPSASAKEKAPVAVVSSFSVFTPRPASPSKLSSTATITASEPLKKAYSASMSSTTAIKKQTMTALPAPALKKGRRRALLGISGYQNVEEQGTTNMDNDVDMDSIKREQSQESPIQASAESTEMEVDQKIENGPVNGTHESHIKDETSTTSHGAMNGIPENIRSEVETLRRQKCLPLYAVNMTGEHGMQHDDADGSAQSDEPVMVDFQVGLFFGLKSGRELLDKYPSLSTRVATAAEKELLEKSPVASVILDCLVAQGRRWIQKNESGTGYKITNLDVHLLKLSEVMPLIKEYNIDQASGSEKSEVARLALHGDENSEKNGWSVYTKQIKLTS